MELIWILYPVFLLSITSAISESVNRSQHSITNECPAQEDIPKCKCQMNQGGLFAICRHFKADSELLNHLKSLQGYSLRKLEIKDYVADSIPTNIWEGQEIEELSLENVEVKDASFRRGQRHFQGLENSLQLLDIRKSFKNGHRPLLNLQLDHLENLENIIMEENNIPEVGNDWFASGPKKISVLIFEKNGIEELGDRAFSFLSNLRLLAVSGNHLNSISRSMLPETANRLTVLDLTYNKISTLPSDIFSGMPSLEEVHLDFNLLHVIPEDTWSSVSSKLKTVTLRGNLIQCDENLRWICASKRMNIFGKCSSPLTKKGMMISQFCKS